MYVFVSQFLLATCSHNYCFSIYSYTGRVALKGNGQQTFRATILSCTYNMDMEKASKNV